MPLIQLEEQTGLTVNVAEISHMSFTSSNGDSCLAITLRSGVVLLVRHGPHTGTNIRALHRRLIELFDKAEAQG